jgi:hypothetical protein
MMYTDIKPLGLEELKAIGDGKFPHEAPAATETKPENK